MNKYDKEFYSLCCLTGMKGFWFENDIVAIGFSFCEISVDDDFEIDYMESEEDYVCMAVDEGSISHCFEVDNEDVKFCFTKLDAIDGNFITWEEFKNKVDDGSLKVQI